MKKKQGFTLIELMLVIVIIGVIAAIAIPALDIGGTSDRAKRTTTEVTITRVANAVTTYYMDTGKYPANLDALVNNPGAKGWKGPYLKKLRQDAWNEDLLYTTTGSDFEVKSNAGGSEGGPISSRDL